MKLITAIFFLSIVLYVQTSSYTQPFSKLSISIQPLDAFDKDTLNLLKNEIANFWHSDVTMLKPLGLPDSYNSQILNQYSADSILQLLTERNKEKNKIIIGLTHKNLYTIKEANQVSYYDQGIFGLGFQPGNCCVVSDFKIATLNDTGYIHALRSTILHEMGHNRGLAHCSNTSCLMSDQGSLLMLLKLTDFCQACKAKLRH